MAAQLTRPEPEGQTPSAPSSAAGPAALFRLTPPDLRAEYTRLLGELNPAALRDVLSRRGVSVDGATSEAHLAEAIEALSRPENLRAAWARLSPHARLALKVMPFLVSASEAVQSSSIKQALQALDPEAAAHIESALQELMGTGLLFFNRYRGFDFPRAIVSRLPPCSGFVPAVPDGGKGEHSLRVEPGAGPLELALLATRVLLVLKAEGERLRSRAEPAPHPLLRQLPALQHWPVAPAELEALAREPNPAGAAYRRAFTVPAALPPLTDEARLLLTRELAAEGEQLDFAVRLLDALGLVELGPGRPVKVVEPQTTDFFQLAPLERTSSLINAWIELRTWTEFDRLADRHPPIVLRHRATAYGATYPQMLISLAQARLSLLLQVRNAMAGQWSDAHALAARARGLNHLNGIWPDSHNVWYADCHKREPNMLQAGDWNAVYGPFVEAVLTGPLRWLGLVDLAYRAEQLVGFRPTELGAFVFCEADAFAPPPVIPSGPVLSFGAPRRAARGNGKAADAHSSPASADLSVTLRVEASDPQLLALLNRLGEASSGPAGTLVFTLTAAGASRAFEAGWTVDTILETLAHAAGQPVPEAMAQTLGKWQHNFGDVQVYTNVTLLELADDYILNELMVSTSLAQHVLYRFSPRLVALRPEGLEALQADLVKKGYTPDMRAEA
jgi:hypothetical protein